MKRKPVVKRAFLRNGASLDAISSIVCTSNHNGRTYGSFSLAVGASYIHIHALDENNVKCSDELYRVKLNGIIRYIDNYIKTLQDRDLDYMRTWLNPEDSGASGSVAYHHDAESQTKIAFFEIASCNQKFRLQMMTFTPAEYDRHINLLSKIKNHLIQHVSAFEEWSRMLKQDSVNEQ